MAVAVAAVIYSCEDAVDTDNIDIVSIPPNIESFTPADGDEPLLGDTFDIKVFFTDGEQSPLSSATVTLWAGDSLTDPNLTQIATITESVSGTSDSVVWSSDDFESYNLDTANYIVTVSVSDTESNTTEGNIAFTVKGSLYVSVNSEMYIAGSFNGWAATPEALEDFTLELTADYTWSISDVPLNGGGWKFKNTVEWTDEDWGDPDCDGVMEITTGGGPNTECGFSGLADITFNDQTLEYTVTLKNPPASNINGLYLVGSFNNFQGNDDYKFELDTSNTWVVNDAIIGPGDVFLFSEAADLSERIWGDNEPDSTADAFGSSIVAPDDFQEGFYKVTYEDISRRYYLQFDRGLAPNDLFLVGGSTGATWDANTAIQFEEAGDRFFRTYNYITTDGDGFKFLPQRGSFDGDYGDNGSGGVVQEGESNATVAADGFYRVDVNFNDFTWSATESNWGIIGDATPGGWDADTDMALVSTNRGEISWTITLDLTAGECKFRENDDWGINYGDSDGDGTLDFNSSNIAIAEAGNYTVTVTFDSDAGYTYTIVKN